MSMIENIIEEIFQIVSQYDIYLSILDLLGSYISISPNHIVIESYYVDDECFHIVRILEASPIYVIYEESWEKYLDTVLNILLIKLKSSSTSASYGYDMCRNM